MAAVRASAALAVRAAAAAAGAAALSRAVKAQAVTAAAAPAPAEALASLGRRWPVDRPAPWLRGSHPSPQTGVLLLLQRLSLPAGPNTAVAPLPPMAARLPVRPAALAAAGVAGPRLRVWRNLKAAPLLSRLNAVPAAAVTAAQRR